MSGEQNQAVIDHIIAKRSEYQPRRGKPVPAFSWNHVVEAAVALGIVVPASQPRSAAGGEADVGETSWTVSDEAVKFATDAYWRTDGEVMLSPEEAMRAALQAALPHLRPSVAAPVTREELARTVSRTLRCADEGCIGPSDEEALPVADALLARYTLSRRPGKAVE